ncbi:MAG: helix-turn-helix domain-containing protein [Bacteroidales bacterium]|nr:helix-turn-helix domain-containing protein [Bacteroidales bacterium]
MQKQTTKYKNTIMNIKELLTSATNVSLTISVADLHEFLLQIVNDNNMCKEQATEETYLTREEVSTMLGGVTYPTLWRWDKTGYLSPTHMGRKVRYRKSDVIKILEDRAV